MVWRFHLLTIQLDWPRGWKLWSKDFWQWLPEYGVLSIAVVDIDLPYQSYSLFHLGYYCGEFYIDVLFLRALIKALVKR